MSLPEPESYQHADWRRAWWIAHAIGKLGVTDWLEAGIRDGVTAAIFAPLVERVHGCDVLSTPLEQQARPRLPKANLWVGEAVEWLKGPELNAVQGIPFCFLDAVWQDPWVGLDELDAIMHRWTQYVALVHAVRLKGLGNFRWTVETTAEEVVEHVRGTGVQVIRPNYSTRTMVSSYVIVNASGVDLALGPEFEDIS